MFDSKQQVDIQDILDLLDLEDEKIVVTEIHEKDHHKFITVETAPIPHYCPIFPWSS